MPSKYLARQGCFGLGNYLLTYGYHIKLTANIFSTGIEYDYYGVGEFWGCKSIFNDFGIQFRYFAYQRASLTGGMAVKAGQSVLSIMTVNTSDPQEFPKLR